MRLERSDTFDFGSKPVWRFFAFNYYSPYVYSRWEAVVSWIWFMCGGRHWRPW